MEHKPYSPHLARLLRPKSVAVIGGDWAKNVIDQCQRMGFEGPIWPVNPKRSHLGEHACFASIDQLPAVPDAVFLAVNRHQAVDSVRALSAMGAGGVVCFASGFLETGDDEGAALQAALVQAAGDMPVLGPNCYGFVNALDRAAVWPDVHGMAPVDRGVAIISQSSNIAINLTMQQRGLPVAYCLTVGNGAMLSIANLIEFAASQDEVTAIGLYVEGFGDASSFHAACQFAKAKGKPVVALKAGASEGAQAITMSHTASLAGADDIATAFLERRCAVGRLHSIEGLLECLKLLHFVGPLPDATLASMSCSGGEASMIADAAQGAGVDLPAFDDDLVNAVKKHCHPLVQVSNPFDYHTFDWGKPEPLRAMYSAVMKGPQAITALVLDWPKAGTGDEAGWTIAADAWIASLLDQRDQGARAVVLASMAENMPAKVQQSLAAGGVAPMQGFAPFMEAVRAAAVTGQDIGKPPIGVVQAPGSVQLLNEHESKQLIAATSGGIDFPPGKLALDANQAVVFAGTHHGQVVMKACGDIAHKSDIGGVVLRPQDPAATFAALQPLAGQVLVEALADAAIAEVLVGVHRDPVVGLCLTVGMGGTMTEVWQDSVTLPLPISRHEVGDALQSLKLSALLAGFRGGEAADTDALVAAIVAVADFAAQYASHLVELDINPLMVHRVGEGATAVDAVLRMVEGFDHEHEQ